MYLGAVRGRDGTFEKRCMEGGRVAFLALMEGAAMHVPNDVATSSSIDAWPQ